MRELLTRLKNLRFAPGVIALVCCVAPLTPLQAAESPALSAIPDVRILFEVSNAMQSADPGQVRAEAASMLVRMLPDDGRGGIWVYGDHVSSLVDHGRTDVFWKRLATVQSRELVSQGETVDLGAALLTAAWDADEESNLQRHIIIIGSGRYQSGDAAADVTKRDQLLNDTANKFAAAGIHVHSVVLPGVGDSGVLRPLAERTGGLYIKVRNVAELGKAFETLLDRTAMPPLLSVKDGAFLVEPGLAEITMWRSGDEADLELVDPAGVLHTRASPGESVHWHDARGYDVVTIVDPEPGRWHFKGESSARVFAVGDLALKVAEVPATLFPGFANHIDFMLFAGAEAVTDPSFLSMTRADAELVGEGASLPLFVESLPDGVFRIRLTDEVDGGSWKLNISLTGPTFAREVSIPFVLANPVEVSVRQDGKNLVAFAEFADASVDYGSLKATVHVRKPPSVRQSFPATPFPGGLWQIVVPDSEGELEMALSFYGRYQNQTPFELHTEALQVVSPLAAEQFFRFDAKGRALKSRLPASTTDVHETSDTPDLKPLEATASESPGGGEHAAVGTTVSSEPEPALPIWFVAAASVLNLLVAVGLGWFLSRRQLPKDLVNWLEERKPEPA